MKRRSFDDKKRNENFEITTVRLKPWQKEAVYKLGGSTFIRIAIARAIEKALRDGMLPLANGIRRETVPRKKEKPIMAVVAFSSNEEKDGLLPLFDNEIRRFEK